MIVFWTIVVLATIGLVYIWIRLVKMIIPSDSLEIKSSIHDKTMESEYIREVGISFSWLKKVHSLILKKNSRPFK